MQKAISSFIILLLCFSLLCEQSCFAIALPSPNLPPPPTAENKEKKIKIELRDGQEKTSATEAVNKVAALGPISPDQLKHLLDRLPPANAASQTSSFNIPADPSAPPKPGGTVKQEFPPKQSQERPQDKRPLPPLKVLHYTPEGAAGDVKQVSITFSQAMIPLSSAESNAEEKNIPVKMSPNTGGQWRWLGTQTLAFIPTGKTLPRSTDYHLEIPANTKSLAGSNLNKGLSWHIETPRIQATSMIPADGSSSISLSPVIVLLFNQKIEASAVLKAISVTQAGVTVPVRIASNEEIKKAPTLEQQLKTAAKNKWIAITPLKQLQKAQQVSIKIGPDLPSAEGPLKSNGAQTFSFRTYGPLQLQQNYEKSVNEPYVYLPLSNQIDASKFNSKMVHISPAAAKAEISATDGIYIQNGLKANTTYTFTLDKAIKDVYGQNLSGRSSATVRVLESNPELSQPDEQMLIIQKGKQTNYSLLSRGAKNLKVNFYSCQVNDFAKYCNEQSQYNSWHEDPKEYKELGKFTKIGEQSISIPYSETQIESRVDLKKYLHGNTNNVILTVESLPRKKDQLNRYAIWIESTNIGLDIFRDGNSLLVMASRLDTGAPISGASVVLSKAKETGVTDKDGIVRFPFRPSDNECVVCKSGDDQAFQPLDLYGSGGYQGETQIPDLSLNTSPRADAIRWYCITDRNLYKPGEKVHAKGWIRKFTAGPEGDLQLLKKAIVSVDYQINDGTGRDIGKGTALLDESGGFDFSFDLPKDANLGNGQINLSANPGTSQLNVQQNSLPFQIADFRRPEFELSISRNSSNAIVFGDAANLTANAKYFAGGVLSDAPISWTVSSSSGQYAPPGWSEYSFGRCSSIYPFFDAFAEPEDDNACTETKNGKTDSDGKSTLQIKVTKIAKATPISLVATASVEDLNRQQWTENQTLLLHPSNNYVGLKSEKQMYRAAEPLKLSAIVTTIDGKICEGSNVHLDVFTEETAYSKDGSPETKKKILSSSDFKSELKEKYIEIPVSKGGRLKVLATTTDGKGRKNETEISLWKEETVEKTIEKVEEGKLVLIADRKDYKPGQAAAIMLQAPFKAAQGIISIRHNGILESRQIHLKDNSSVFEIPITEKLMPNAIIQANLTGDNCKFASGTVMLMVPPDSRKLKLEVNPESKSIAPGQKTTVNVKVSRPDATAASSAHLAVAVVDEAVLALSAYDWQDPASAFYLGAVSDTEELHNRRFVLAATPPKAKAESPAASLPPPPAPGSPDGFGTAGGSFAPRGALMKAANTVPRPLEAAPVSPLYAQAQDARAMQTPITLRKDFNAVAFFNPNLITDEKGVASFEFQAPDNLTRYRVMVVAVEGEQLCGKGESTITARLPLMVKPSAPRFLNFGDKCELPVLVQNQTDTEMSVDIGLRANNLIFELAGSNADPGAPPSHSCGASVVVPANDRIELRFPAHTERDGEATIDIAASSKEASDAANVSMPVYTPATSQAFADYGQIDGVGATEEIVQLPADVYDQIGGLEISSSSTALQSLTDAYFFLRDYEFLCSEQLSSRVLSVCSLQDFLSAFNKITDAELQKTKTQVQKDLDELCKRQNSDGSFGLWKRGEPDKWAFLSAQVARALIEAQAAGYRVPSTVLENAKRNLSKNNDAADSKQFDSISRRTIQAYSLFVLHLAKQSDARKAAGLVRAALTPDKAKDAASQPKSSDLEMLKQNLATEAMAWLLPVLATDKQYSKESDLLRSTIKSQIGETAEHASIDSDPYANFGYAIFFSPTRQDAVVLETMIMDQPESDLIPKLAKGLLMQRKAGKWHTRKLCRLARFVQIFSYLRKTRPSFQCANMDWK